jgi:2-C-methyl-D-erythritol 4-phosphate cytidylyltransferase
MAERTSAVILAAGRGIRLGVGRNKVFLELAGRPLLAYTLDAFLSCPSIDEVLLVVAPYDEALARDVIAGVGGSVRLVHGGKERRDSSLAGVRAATGNLVLIHDAARPFPSAALIARIIEGARAHGACVPVVPSTDTLRYRDESATLHPHRIERRGLLRMQTPQGFRTDLIRSALTGSAHWFTDDAGAILETGLPVFTVPGEETNLKVTTPGDLRLAEALAAHGLSAPDAAGPKQNEPPPGRETRG